MERSRCMKSSRTLQCKICMVERKEILHRLKNNKHQVINDNSDIYSSCKFGSRIHKFNRTITTTLRTRSTQKKSPFKKEIQTKAQENQQNKNAGNSRYQPILSCNNSRISYIPTNADSIVPTNADSPRHKRPGLPYRSPSYHPTNLELAQFAQYQTLLDNSTMEVYQI